MGHNCPHQEGCENKDICNGECESHYSNEEAEDSEEDVPSQEETVKMIQDAIRCRRTTLKKSKAFYGGQVINLKGFMFEVVNVGSHTLRLRILTR